MQKEILVANYYSVRFTRRGYPRTEGPPKVFTWAEVRVGEEWFSLGDPWEKIRPSNKELLEAIEKVLCPILEA